MTTPAPAPASAPVRVPAPGWRAAESPFHVGELAAQERVGVRERMNVDARRGIRDYMPEQHRTFFAEQPFMVLATQNPLDMEGTYPLPEAQRDRFTARISMGYPDRRSEIALLGEHAASDPLSTLRLG